MIFKILSVFVCLVNVIIATNYCDRELCQSWDLEGNEIYEDHIACGHSYVGHKFILNH